MSPPSWTMVETPSRTRMCVKPISCRALRAVRARSRELADL